MEALGVQTRDLVGKVGRDLHSGGQIGRNLSLLGFYLEAQTLVRAGILCLEVQIQSRAFSCLVLSGPANLHDLGNLQDLPPPSLHPRPSPPPVPPAHLR